MGELLREVLREVTGSGPGYWAELLQSLALIAILWWAVKRQAGKRLTARRERVVAELAEAEEAEREAVRLTAAAVTLVGRAKEEGPALLRQAEAAALAEREAALVRIDAEATALLAQARQAVERDKLRVSREAGERLVSLTAEATRRYLDEMLGEGERRALTQQAIRESLEALRAPTPAEPRAG